MQYIKIIVIAGITAAILTGCAAGAAPNIEKWQTVRISSITKDEKELEKALKAIGVKAAMGKLVEESGGGGVFDCHQESHHIGRLGYKLFAKNVFAACDASCHSGCYHGAIETFLNEKGTENIAKDVPNMCSLFATNFGIFECLHGVGHGVLAYLDYDMPEAINTCKNLGTDFGSSSCYGGMFMENILTGQGLGAREENHTTKWANKTDPLFPCNTIDQSWAVQYQCYQMQTSWMLTINNYDFDKVAKLCSTIPQEYIPVCFKSFGRDAAGHTLRNPTKIIELCNKVPHEKDYYEQCVIGAVNVIVDFWGDGLRNQATELCRKLDIAGKTPCYTTLAGRLPDVLKENAHINEICDAFEVEYKNLCSSMSVASASKINITPASSTSEIASVSQASGTTITIEMNDKIFRPEELNVTTGIKVIFKNVGSQDRWPASNIHPTHGIYPEFDPKGPVKSGSSWQKVFDKKGSWRYHDHLAPEIKGIVTVK